MSHADDEPAREPARPDTEAGRRDSLAHRIRSIEAAAIAGVAYAVLSVLALGLLSQFPDLEQSDAEIAEWFADSANQTTLILGCNLVALSAIMFLWFVAVIRRRLGDLEDRFFGTVFLGSGLAFVAVWLGYGASLAGPAVAASHIAGAVVSVDSASTSAGTAAAFLLVLGPRVEAVFVIVTSTLIVRSRVLPTWLAFVGYVFALAMLIVPLVADPLGLGFPVWVLLVSVVILAARPRARQGGSAG